MPTYDYECTNCKHALEIFHGMSETPSLLCPSCNQEALAKRISGGAGVLFKGSGFYQTDYRSSDYIADSNKDKPAPSCQTGGGCDGCPNSN